MTTAIPTASIIDRDKDIWLTLFWSGLLTTISGLGSFWLRPAPLVTWGAIAGGILAPLLIRWLVVNLSFKGALIVLGLVFMTGFLGSFVGVIALIGPLYNQVRWVAPLCALGSGLLWIALSPNIWRTLRLPWGPISAALLLFLLYAFISISYSSSPLTTLGRAVTFMAVTLGTGAALWPVVQRIEQAERILVCIAVLMAIVILPGEVYIFIPKSIGWHSSGRFRSTFWNPVTFSHLCALFLPLYWWCMVKDKSHLLQRGAAAMMIGILLINLYLTGSRSGALALIVIVPVIGWYFVRQQTRLVLIALLLLAVTLATAFQAKTINLFFTRGAAWSNNYSFYSGRLEDWQKALRLWSQSPVFGTGFGSIGSSDAALLDENARSGPVGSSSTAGLRLSNLYLETLGSGGTVGAGLLLYLLIQLFRTLLRAMRNTHPSTQASSTQALITMMLATFLGGLVLNLTETWLVSAGSPFAMYWWLVMFLAARVATIEQNSNSIPQQPVRSF